MPDTVIWGPPGMRVWVPIMNSPAEFAVSVCGPSVITCASPRPLDGVMDIVLVPITTAVAPGARLIGVPETVIAEPPGTRVWVPMTKLLAAFAVIVSEPTVITGGLGGGFGGVIATVLGPTAMAVAPGARLTGVPETVISGPPGTRVCDPTTKLVAEFAVIVDEPSVITGAATALDGLPC